MLGIWMAATFGFLAAVQAWVLRGERGWWELARARRVDSSRWRNASGPVRQHFYAAAVLGALAVACAVIGGVSLVVHA